MKLHKIKPTTGWIEIAGLFIIDRQLAFSKLLSKLMTIRETQLNLSSAEQSLPRREVSYIYKANQMSKKEE